MHLFFSLASQSGNDCSNLLAYSGFHNTHARGKLPATPTIIIMLRKTFTVALATSAITAVSAAVDSGCDDAISAFSLKLINKDPTGDSPSTAATMDGPCKYADDACPAACAAAWTTVTEACTGKEYTSLDGTDTAADFDSTDFSVVLATVNSYRTVFSQDDACNADIDLMKISAAADCTSATTLLAYGTATYSCADPQSTADTCHKNCQAIIDNVVEQCDGQDMGGVPFDANTFLTSYQEAYSLPAACDYTGPSSGASVVGVSAAAIVATATAALLAVA